MDRDLNAALNLEQWIETTASSAGSNACRERIRPEYPALLVEAGTEHHGSELPNHQSIWLSSIVGPPD